MSPGAADHGSPSPRVAGVPQAEGTGRDRLAGLRRIADACGVLTVLLGVLAAILLILEVLLVSAAVLQREFSIVMLTGTTEYVDVLLAALAFCSLAYAQRSGAHVKVDFVLSRMPTRTASSLGIGGGLCGVVVLAWLTYATFQSGLHAYEIREVRFGLLALPVWPVKLLIPLALAAWTVEMLRLTLRDLAERGDAR